MGFSQPTRHEPPHSTSGLVKITGAQLDRAARAIHAFLDERFPGGVMPGGRQLFADDALDPGFKHEAACEELARRVLEAALKN